MLTVSAPLHATQLVIVAREVQTMSEMCLIWYWLSWV